ncbi:ABC transporter substrate-binding protein [Geitlerinema sp. PCC 9228]|uniref:ABC transporter substrate-binding protein n=1 Tax=Geitlerinema sp. PCC 9228 TaxID=111611 RepID=UPI0008F9D004|nr:ABC transporter substrate-binding protein [Geitlerinema sp. PCC 9228]
MGTSQKPTRKFIAVTTAVLAGGLLAACGNTAQNGGEGQPGTETTAQNGSEGLKIGALLPATGDLSSIGQYMIDALPVLVDTVNQCGGVNGAPVTLVQEDSQTEPAAAAEAMTKLTEVDNVAGVVGAFGSSISNAAVDIAARNQVMMISPGSTSTIFTERAQNGDFNGYWARTAPPDSYQAEALASLAMERGFDSVATAVINNDYGVGFEEEFVPAFQDMGGSVVNEGSPVRYDPKATTFESEATAAFSDNPDAVMGVLYVETGALFLKAAYQQGLMQDATVLLTDGVYSGEFPEKVGKNEQGEYILEGALGTTVGAGGPGLEQLQAALGTEPEAFVPHTWDAGALLMLAAEAGDTNTGEAIKENLRAVANPEGQEVSDVCQALELLRNGEEINYQGASSRVDIDELGNVRGVYDVWTVNADGSLETVEKIDVQEQQGS